MALDEPDATDEIPSFIHGTPAERAAIVRRGRFALRSCLTVIVLLLVFEGAVLGGTKFGWPGLLLGPIVIYGASVLLGLAGFFVLVFIVDRSVRPAAKEERERNDHPLADDDVDAGP